VLDGAEVLPNPKGTAPGQWLRLEGRALILLPGPPRELEPMFENECLPRLAHLPSPYRYCTCSLRVALLAESEVDDRIAPIYSADARVVTTILAAPGDIQVHLKARATTEAEAREIAEALGRKVDQELGDAVFSHTNEVLEEAIGRLLRERGETLAAAESCTGGLLAERITAFSGSSDYFIGSFVTYTSAAKANWIGVDAGLIERHGAVSAETAAAMAQAVREKAGSTYGISITGFAGPTGGTEEAPVGTVFIGLADGVGVSVLRRRFGSERDRVRMLAAIHALEMLRRRILGLAELQSV
jgi:nicotinamide-nucleotide amidase